MQIDSQNKPLALITRPVEDAMALAEYLQGNGVDVWIEPMLTIQIKPNQAQSLIDICENNVQAIAVTSANGVRALAALTDIRNIQIIAVGEASMEEARQKSFQLIDVVNPAYGGNSEGMVRYIAEKYNPKGGMILHASGQDIISNLSASLKNNGFVAGHIVLYTAIAAQGFSKETTEAFTNGRITSLFVYSARTAEIILHLLDAATMTNCLKNVVCYCLSQNIADVFNETKLKQLRIVKKPTFSAMRALIEEDR